MIHLDHHAIPDQFRIFKNLRNSADLARGDPHLQELLAPLGRRLGLEDGSEDGIELIAVGHPILVRQEAGVFLEVGQTQLVAEREPEAVVPAGDVDIAVRRLEKPVGSPARVLVPQAPRVFADAHVLAARKLHQRHHGVEHRDVHVLTATGRDPLEKRIKDPLNGVEGADQVRDGDRHLHGLAVRLSGDGHQPALPLDDRVIGADLFGAAVSGNRTVDQAGIPGRDGLVAETQLVAHTRPEIFDEDVGPVDEPPEHLLALGTFQIQRDALLVAVHLDEPGALAVEKRRRRSRIVPFAGRLDLDHFGPHLSQLQRAGRPGHHTGQINHFDSGQRQHGLLILSCFGFFRLEGIRHGLTDMDPHDPLA